MKIFLIFIITLLSLSLIFGIWFLADRLFISDRIISTVESTQVKHEQAIQIEVLNSTGIDGLASKTMEYLRKRGFDVVRVGNYTDSIYRKSVVIMRDNNQRNTQNVASALAISDSCIVIRPDSSLFLNCSVLIGKDYKTLSPFK